MLILSGTLKMPVERLDALEDAMNRLIAATRPEEGCIVYSFGRDITEPGLVRIYEEWESRELLAAHVKTAHVAEWHRILAEAGGAETSLKLVDVASTEPFA